MTTIFASSQDDNLPSADIWAAAKKVDSIRKAVYFMEETEAPLIAAPARASGMFTTS
jgi:hypothetical protein